MAQPSGQLLLDTGGPFYGYFWYANDTTTAGLWDARTGALATKTGTGGVTTEGGADVAVSSGSTYYTLAAPLTLTGNFTIGLRARINAAGQAAMVMGDRTGLDHFLWLNNGSNELRLRATGNTLSVANGAATTLATYYITRSGGVVTAYRDGVSLGGMGTATENFVIRHLMDGYDSGTYALAGVAEFFHIIPGVAISAGQVASLSSDPYQVLVAAAASFSGSVTLDGSTPSGSFTTAPPSSFAGAVTLEGAAPGGSFGPAPGTFTSPPLSSNNGTVLASAALSYVAAYDASTGALVARFTGLSTDGLGRFTVSSASLLPGTTLRWDWEALAGQRRMPLGVVA